MWLTKLVIIVAAVCLPACYGASLSEVAEGQKNARLGYDPKYYLWTLQHALDATGMEEITNDPTAITELSLDGTEDVAIIIHGREDGINGDFGVQFRNTINQERDMVLIFVDWSFVAYLDYSFIFALAPTVASDVASFITNMETAGKLNLANLYIVGFDVGAHIAGIASRVAGGARKIIALSPAADRWDVFPHRLMVTDALFVETINTDAVGVRAYGLPDGIGGLDFFPNGGTRQPGCANSDNWCHHNRAWRLFVATVEQRGHLFGRYCQTLTQVTNGRCDASMPATLGTYRLYKEQTGRYRVETGRTHPFSV